MESVLAYGEQTSILELAKKILGIAGTNSEVVFTPERIGDIQDSVGDIEQATRHPGLRRGGYPLQQGLVETISWYREHTEKLCAA